MAQYSSLKIRCFSDAGSEIGYDGTGRDNVHGLSAVDVFAASYNSNTPFAVLSKTLRLGMRTDVPNTTVDINGDFATRWDEVGEINNGINHNVYSGEYSSLFITTNTDDITITGFTHGYNGKEITLYLTTIFKTTIANNNSGSAAGNRIITLSGQDLEFEGPSILHFKYHEDKWIYCGSGSQLNNITYRFTTRSVLLYSAGTPQKTHAKVMIFETYDSGTDKFIAQYGFLPQYDEVGTDTFGYNSLVMFHHIGTEKGNCYIEGLSPTGPPTPDYWFSAITQFKHGTHDTDMFYNLAFKYWSEDRNNYLVQRPLEVANVKRRIYVVGRFHCLKTIGGVFGPFTWDTLASNPWPMSNIECYKDTDLGMLAATAAAPTLIGNMNDIELDFGTKLKPVSIMAQAWGANLNPAFNNQDWQIGANPVDNQQTTANRVRFTFWLNDWAAIVGARHKVRASGSDLDAMPQLDVFYVDFWGTLEVVGENATVT